MLCHRPEMNHVRVNKLSGKRLVLGVVLATLSLSACLMGEVINEAPVPGIHSRSPGPYYINDHIEFDATKSVDDESEGLIASWTLFSCLEGRVPQACVKLDEAIERGLDRVFPITIVSHETLKVELRVTDAYGATRLAPATFTIDVSNRDPDIDMQVTGYREDAGGPFVVSRAIQLIAISKASELDLVDRDGDALELSWQLFPPAGSDSSVRSFAPMGEAGSLLVPDVAGLWKVKLEANDEFGGSDEITKEFTVGPDGPPCLQGMDPVAMDDAYYLVESGDGPRHFSVLSVRDALDPYPAAIDTDPVLGEASFRWFVQEPGSASFVELPDLNAASYVVDPLVYSPGDTLAIRVEVSDRVEGPSRTLPCAVADWSCQLDTGSGCFQRQTWGVQIQ